MRMRHQHLGTPRGCPNAEFLIVFTVVVFGFTGNAFAHLSVGFDVAHAVIIHNAQVATAEGFGHGAGDFGFGFDDKGAHFLNTGCHFLLLRNGHCSAFFGAGLCDNFVGFGLIGLKFGTDVVPYIDVCDVDPVLVLPAGLNAQDAADMSAIFSRLGCRTLIATQLDVARRLGAILAAAQGGNLALSVISISPSIAKGLTPLNPMSLARVLLRDPGESHAYEQTGVRQA